ncbi:hypothetical protein R6Q59_023572 [Mikania micrantha]
MVLMLLFGPNMSCCGPGLVRWGSYLAWCGLYMSWRSHGMALWGLKFPVWWLLFAVVWICCAWCGLGWLARGPCLALGRPLQAGYGTWCSVVDASLGWKDTTLGPLFGLDMGFLLANYTLYFMGFSLYMGLWLEGWTFVPLHRFWVVVGYLDLWAIFIVLGLSGCRPQVFLYRMYCSLPNGLSVILLAFPGLSDKCYSGGMPP